MKYKVKLNYPTIVVISGKEYLLFPGKVVKLPDDEIVQTYKGLGYLEPIPETSFESKTTKTKKEVSDAS